MSQFSDFKTFTWSAARAWTENFDFGSVPERPAFYVFTDFSGPLEPSNRPNRNVFYVGQTVKLRRRLRQHRDGIGPAGSRLGFQLLVWRSQGQGLFVRWATDERASIEKDLINQLRAVHNDEYSEWS